MNISDKKKTELYKSIDDVITEMRIEIQRYGSPSSDVLDYKLYNMQKEIWRGVHKALNIKTPA